MAELNFPEMIRDKILQLGEDAAKSVIAEWVSTGQEEHLYLDFARKSNAARGTLDQDDKRGFAKAISGFANSDGGLLTWGVVAEKPKAEPGGADKARQAESVSELDTFLGQLNAIVSEATKPVVAGVQNIPVWEDREANRGWVVSYIPAGASPPYRAEKDNNNHFYKRAGSSFYPMEPYDIRDVVFRFRYPKIQMEMSYEARDIKPDKHTYDLLVQAYNHGPSALTDWKIEVEMPRLVSIETPQSAMETEGPEGPIWVWRRFSARLLPETRVLYPGDPRRLVGPGGPWPVVYIIDDMSHDEISDPKRRRQAEPMVVCRLFGVDMPPVEIRRPLRELQKF